MTSLGPCANNTLPISSLPPIRYIEQRDPELIALQQRTHLPRIPRATNACPQPLTLEQLIDWKSLWARKHRPSTQSERDDHSECDRQINNVASDSNHDLEVYDSEEERNQARREAHQRPLSPPSTPPHLKGPKLYKNRGLSVAPQTGSSKVKKAKSKSRVAPRRPYTRSREAPAVSLHHRKGQLVYWRLPWQYTVMGFDEYLRDFVSWTAPYHQARADRFLG